MCVNEIILVSEKLSQNGADRVLTELANQWTKCGKKVTLIQLLREDSSVDEGTFILLPAVSVKKIITNTRSKSGFYIKSVQAVSHILRQKRNAVVISFLSRSIYVSAVCSLIPPRSRHVFVFSERNDPSRWPNKRFTRLLRNLSFCCADICVFQTGEAKKYFFKRVQRKGIIIPNPINPELPERFTGTRRKTNCTACRLVKQKNIPMMISAFHKVHMRYPEYTLEIYGEGSERKILQDQIDQLNLKDNAFLCGFTDDIFDKMRDCAMYVCSSDYEGISNALMEAMAMGVPSISTDCPIGGARAMIQDGANGLLVPVGDVDTLASAMFRLISEPLFAQKLADQAWQSMREYDIKEIANQWLNVMSGAMKGTVLSGERD